MQQTCLQIQYIALQGEKLFLVNDLSLSFHASLTFALYFSPLRGSCLYQRLGGHV